MQAKIPCSSDTCLGPSGPPCRVQSFDKFLCCLRSQRHLYMIVWGGCRYLQASGMRRKGVYRVNSAVLILSFVATHILSVGLVLVRYCQQRHISWRQMPSRCGSVRPHFLPLAAWLQPTITHMAAVCDDVALAEGLASW